MKTGSFLTGLLVSLVVVSSAHADEHTLRIVVHVLNGGAVGMHVSHYEGKVEPGMDYHGIHISIPVGPSKYTKLISRDDDRKEPNLKRVRKDWPEDESVKNGQGGIYIMDLSDWDGDPEVEVEFYIDGKLRFKGHGSAKNFKDWANKEYGEKTRQADDREVAVDIG